MSVCDTLDLNGIGKIQGYGYLFSLDKASLLVEHVSSNICSLTFSILSPPEEFIGCETESCFSEEASVRMQSMIETISSGSDEPGVHTHPIGSYFEYKSVSYMISLEETFSEYLFSIYEDTPPVDDIGSIHTNFIKAMLSSTTQKGLFEETCMAITDIVGYDRAMVYKFKDDLSGEVVYEWIDPSMHGKIEPYIGMHFPESDIPLPARQMYLLKHIRIIHDTSSEAVDVIGNKPLNMSRCIIRASHDVHTTYMKNMGVRSSMSLAIIINSDLWGIMSFHSYRNACIPKNSIPRIFESICTSFSMILNNIIMGEYTERQERLSGVLDRLLASQSVSKYLSDNHLEILKITGTESIHLGIGDEIESWGSVGEHSIMDDMEKNKKKASKNGFYIGVLKKPTRGIVYILDGKHSIILYRKCIDTITTWGGDPNHVKIKRPDGVPGPRGSFERYILKNEGVLKPWTQGDKDLIRFMSNRIHLFMVSKNVTGSVVSPMDSVDTTHVSYNTVEARGVDKSLLAHMSHEILTPLNGIYSSMRIVMDDSDISRRDIENLMGHGLECVQSMQSSVESVLSITECDNPLTPEPNATNFSIKDINDAVISKYSIKLKDKDVAFCFDSHVGKDHSIILSQNTSRIKMCIFSAMENSIRFIGNNGSIFYTVSYNNTHRESILDWRKSVSTFDNKHVTNMENNDSGDDMGDSRTWYTFTVRDTGCGVNEDMMNNVVATIDKSSGMSTEGINNSHDGIGLGIYSGMLDVLKMGGTVGIASSKGVGTSISFILPLLEGDDNHDHILEGIPHDVTEGVFFVVDDSSLNRKMTSRLLKVACKKSFGFEPRIREFSDGKVCMMEVMRMQEVGEKPLCIIMDYHMPVMSGKEATEKIRHAEDKMGIEKKEKIPIVGYTADVTEITKRDLLSSGMDTVTSKPISIDTLTDMCRKLYTNQ